MALPSSQQASMRAAVSEFWNNDKLSVSEAVAKLVAVSAPKQK
jgi:glucose/mannose transport system substrate-binding protein